MYGIERKSMTDHDLRPPRRQQTAGSGTWVVACIVIAAAGVAGWYARDFWLQRETAPMQTPSAAAVSPAPVLSDTQPVVQASESETAAAEEAVAVTGPRHPMAAAEISVQPQEFTLDRLALEWLGQPALKFLVTPGLAQHVVATIDNLPRSHAAPRLWPLSPVGGKMVLEEGVQGLQIAPANSARYDAVVDFVTGIAPAQAAAWYRQAYPLLQTAYEELGYPGKYFNDRLVEVIDHLLLTPEPAVAPAVKLVQVQGEIAPQQPWLRYEYADPQLQSLSAGQKVLLRLGAEHRQRLKAYLRELRAQVASTQ